MNKSFKKTLILFTAAFIFLASAGAVLAQEPNGETEQNKNIIVYKPLEPLPGVTNGEDLGIYLNSLFNFLIGLAAILAVFMIALGGATYIASDSISGKSEGKGFITNAVWGLVLALAAWVILNTINPDLLNLDFNPGSGEYVPPQNATGPGTQLKP